MKLSTVRSSKMVTLWYVASSIGRACRFLRVCVVAGGFPMAFSTRSLSVRTRVSAEPGDGSVDLLTVAEAAAYLRVSRATLWRWCQERRVPGCKIGHEWRINGPALRRQMAAGEQPNPEGDPVGRSAATLT